MPNQRSACFPVPFVTSYTECNYSNEKRSEICIREQFITRMVRYGEQIANCDFDKEKDANVGLSGMSFLLQYKAIGTLKNFGERCQNSRFTVNK